MLKCRVFFTFRPSAAVNLAFELLQAGFYVLTILHVIRPTPEPLNALLVFVGVFLAMIDIIHITGTFKKVADPPPRAVTPHALPAFAV